MKIDRFDNESTGYHIGSVMKRRDDGDYVLFSDHEKIVGELAEALTYIDGVLRNKCNVTGTYQSDFLAFKMAREALALLKKHDL